MGTLFKRSSSHEDLSFRFFFSGKAVIYLIVFLLSLASASWVQLDRPLLYSGTAWNHLRSDSATDVYKDTFKAKTAIHLALLTIWWDAECKAFDICSGEIFGVTTDQLLRTKSSNWLLIKSIMTSDIFLPWITY